MLCAAALIHRGGKRVDKACTKEQEKLLRCKLECCYLQGKMAEAIKVGRKLDELQCQLLRQENLPKRAAG